MQNPGRRGWRLTATLRGLRVRRWGGAGVGPTNKSLPYVRIEVILVVYLDKLLGQEKQELYRWRPYEIGLENDIKASKRADKKTMETESKHWACILKSLSRIDCLNVAEWVYTENRMSAVITGLLVESRNIYQSRSPAKSSESSDPNKH